MSKRKINMCLIKVGSLIKGFHLGWSNQQSAYWSFCSKDFDISNMGCSALTSHASGKKHA